jgi:hypothetical protein
VSAWGETDVRPTATTNRHTAATCAESREAAPPPLLRSTLAVHV